MSTMIEVGSVVTSSSSSQGTMPDEPAPGILVFSRSLQLQYVNRRVLELTQGFSRDATESDRRELPARLLEFRDQIKQTLEDRIRENVWEPFEVMKAVSEQGRRLLLRGFGRPDRTATHLSRVIIVVEEIQSPHEDRSEGGHVFRTTSPKSRRPVAGSSRIHHVGNSA